LSGPFRKLKKVKRRKKTDTLVPGSDIVDAAVLKLPAEERVMVQRLRALVQECLPKASEQAYYGMGVPFYRHNRLICFIWPPSFFWGPKRTKELQQSKGLALGFCQGNKMSNEGSHLLAEGRKQIYCMYFHKLSDINEPLVRALLFEAGMIDEGFGKKTRR
jgi:Domain of unknown function (DU1801)